MPVPGKTFEDFVERCDDLIRKIELENFNANPFGGGTDWESSARVGAAARSLVRLHSTWLGPDDPRVATLWSYVRSLGNYKSSQPNLIAEVKSIREDLELGWGSDFNARVRGETHGSLLDLAAELVEQDENEKMAAVMICGAVLENHLRNLCEKHGVLPDTKGNKSPGIDKCNNALCSLKPGPYGSSQKGAIHGWMQLRNAAAHHVVENFEPALAGPMIEGVAVFIEQHPA